MKSLLRLACLLPALAWAAGEPAAKTHTLFMGADLAVERNKKFYRVEDVSGSEFKIRIGQNEVFVPTRGSANQFRIDHELKLAGAPVTLGKVIADRTYTSARDPRRQFEASSGAAGGAAAVQDAAYGAMIREEMTNAMAQGTLGADPERAHPAVQEAAKASAARLEESMGKLDPANQLALSDQNQVAVQAERMNRQLMDGNFDAIEVAFEVSSPVPLDDPYVLIIARIRDRDSRPGVTRNWIYADTLDPIGTKPQFVRVREGGFPVGYHLEDAQIRIYNRGREVPTSVSPKKVELTSEEARQYIVMEHVAAHRGETLAAVPAFVQPPPDLRDRVAAGHYPAPVFVRVGDDGGPKGAYLDQACSRPVQDPYIEALVAGMIFRPALEKGKPVPGVARIRLGEI